MAMPAWRGRINPNDTGIRSRKKQIETLVHIKEKKFCTPVRSESCLPIRHRVLTFDVSIQHERLDPLLVEVVLMSSEAIVHFAEV